jgi:hypothetical protein
MVDKRTRVVVYGNSLNMAGIAASLKKDANLSETNPGLDIILLRDRPGLLLVGVDACSDKLLVLSSQSSQAHSVADLINVIQRKDPL